MRAKAKMVSYGLAYGMEAYGLAQRLGDRRRRGGRDPRASTSSPSRRCGPTWSATVAEARRRGYTETELGPAPLHARARLGQLPGPPGRRAPGDERRHPGARRRHLQDRPRAPRRRRSSGAGSRVAHRAPGPRRGARRGARRPSTRRSSELTLDAMHARLSARRCPSRCNVAWGTTWADAKQG